MLASQMAPRMASPLCQVKTSGEPSNLSAGILIRRQGNALLRLAAEMQRVYVHVGFHLPRSSQIECRMSQAQD